jgi:hypothetical protein
MKQLEFPFQCENLHRKDWEEKLIRELGRKEEEENGEPDKK